MKIYQDWNKYAIEGAFNDPKYDEIEIEELKDLHWKVQLLVNFEEAKDCYDWNIGQHGIEITFEFNDQTFTGKTLPSTPYEFEWNKQTTLRYMAQKAGYFGELWYIEDLIKLTRFEAKTYKMSFTEYRDILELE